MRIAYWDSGNGGVYWYRVKQIMMLAKESGAEVFPVNLNMSPHAMLDTVSKCDAFYVSSPVSRIWTPIFESFKKSNPNIEIIVDFDDNPLAISPDNRAYGLVGRRNATARNQVTGELVDVWKHNKDGFDIQANKQRLRETYWAIKNNVTKITSPNKAILRAAKMLFPKIPTEYIPNLIDTNLFYPEERVDTGTVNIGYTCSDSHYSDFLEILPVLKEILEENPNVHYYHMGAKFNLSTLPEKQVHYIPWQDGVINYARKLRSLPIDIGICWLADTRFNGFKSPLKWEEFSAMHIPTVCSKKLYSKYVEDGALTVSISVELKDALLTLIKDKELRESLGNKAYDIIQTKYKL